MYCVAIQGHLRKRFSPQYQTIALYVVFKTVTLREKEQSKKAMVSLKRRYSDVPIAAIVVWFQNKL